MQPADSAKVIRYVKPAVTKPRHVVRLARTPNLIVAVQVIGLGGENRLHSHPNLDGFWHVLNGRVRFYTLDDDVIAALGPGEAILIPRNFPYWFESSGDQDLEILQVEAIIDPGEPTRGVLHSISDSEVDFETSEQ